MLLRTPSRLPETRPVFKAKIKQRFVGTRTRLLDTIRRRNSQKSNRPTVVRSLSTTLGWTDGRPENCASRYDGEYFASYPNVILYVQMKIEKRISSAFVFNNVLADGRTVDRIKTDENLPF
uniref:Uncharacterized protein n=1 Tax=Sipha flava TaxID=143950 RepID=A0A2S2QZ96_9HEMI